jgi:hypothetical protein
MKKEGWCEWYQWIGLIFHYISANFLLFKAGGSLPGFFSIAVVTSSDRGHFLCGFSFNFRGFSTAKNQHSYYYCEYWNSPRFSTFNTQIQCHTGATVNMYD